MREHQRGERARVARRVRTLLDEYHSATRAPLVDAGIAAAGHEAEVQPADLGPADLGPADLRPSAWSEPVPMPADAPQRAGRPETVPSSEPAPRPEGMPRSEPRWQVPEAPAGAEQATLPAHRSASSLAAMVSGLLQRRGLRIDPGHRGALAMAAVAALAALVAGWWVFGGRPHAVTVSSSPPAAPSVAPASRPTSSVTPTRVTVDVAGKVRHPGVYRLPAGSRVNDALHAAGGALAGVDLSSLNLARQLGDGEQIAVGVPGAAVNAPPGGAGALSTGARSAPVDLNTANIDQLDSLPGVGPVLAQRIVDWRAAHGQFESIDQLRDVSGIGPSRFADLRPLVTV